MRDRAVIDARGTGIRWLSTGSQFPDQRSIRRELANRMIQIICAINRIVGADRNAVSPCEHAFAPGPNETPLPIKHRDRMIAAIKDENVVA